MPYADPEMRKAVKRQSARTRRAAEPGASRPQSRPDSPELAQLKLESARTGLLLIHQQIEAVQGLELERPFDIMARAKTIAFLVAMGLKVIGVAQHEMQFRDYEDRFKAFLYGRPTWEG